MTVVDCGASVHSLLELETRSFNSDLDMPQGEHPLEAGCHWMVDFRKPGFTGSDAFHTYRESGLKQRMVCLRLDDAGDVAPTLLGGVHVDGESEPVGYIANSGWSPTLGTGIALAYLRTEFAVVGLPVTVDTTDGARPATTAVSSPFLISRSNAPR